MVVYLAVGGGIGRGVWGVHGLVAVDRVINSETGEAQGAPAVVRHKGAELVGTPVEKFFGRCGNCLLDLCAWAL